MRFSYRLTPKVSSRAHEQVERNAYVEPAPVTLESYQDTVLEQAKSAGRISRNEVV
jgi:mannitol-1-phosphate/altronate dehydrogenase